MTPEEIQRAKARHEAELLGKPNVVGVAVGRKVVRGRETDELCLVVLVREKVPADRLQAHELVPPRLDDVKTDVVETGELRALVSLLERATRDPTARWRPAPGGVSVGHVRSTAGTLGCLVHRDDEVLVLSNAHVLGESGQGRMGDPVLQPGPADGGREPEDVLAHLLEAVPLKWDGARRFKTLLPRNHRRNRVDAAVAAPWDPLELTPEILGIGAVGGSRPATLDLALRKSGRTTGVTKGRVTHLDATVSVAYGEGREALFERQILTTAMSEGGDSGSLAVDPDNRAVGLLFAGSNRVSVLNRIEDVLKALRVQLGPPS